MSITTGPLIVPTTGLDAVLGALPGVAAFAVSQGRPLIVLHALGKRYEDYARRRVSESVAQLNGSGPSDVITVPQKERAARLRELAAGGGLLVTLPRRRGFVTRLASMIADYEQLILESPLPVLALPPDGALPSEIRSVLFPIDLSPRSLAALDDVVALCAARGAELHLLHVFGPDRLLASEVNQAERAAAKSPAELYQLDKRHMEELAERARQAGARVTLQQGEGRAHDAILGYLQPHAIDLIVMATHGPRSNEDIWYGTTTARVIRRAGVPVIAVRG